MTIRELINILIDAPDKDEPVKIEVNRSLFDYDDGYQWQVCGIESVNNLLHATIITAEESPECDGSEESEK